MKHFLIIVLVFTFGCFNKYKTCCEKFKNYRYSPFSYPYKEYFYKADTIPIFQIESIDSLVNVFDHTINIPSIVFDSVVDRTSEKGGYHFYKDQIKQFMVVQIHDKDRLGCNDPLVKTSNLDYCDAFDSALDFYQKLYTLVPDDLQYLEKRTAHEWIIHNKGMIFHDTRSIHIYTSENYTAFRRNNNNDKFPTEIVLFHKKNSPYYLSFSFGVKSEELILKILKTIK